MSERLGQRLTPRLQLLPRAVASGSSLSHRQGQGRREQAVFHLVRGAAWERSAWAPRLLELDATRVASRSDSFRLSRKASAPELGLEKGAVLFNVGASFYGSGCACERAADGKGAVAHFQAAAGAWAALREALPAGLAGCTVDLSPECCRALEALALGRAQEGLYDAAAQGGRTQPLCSKLAMAAAQLYGEAMKALGAPPLREALDKTWHAAAALRAATCAAKAAQHAAAQHSVACSGAEKALEAARLAGACTALRNVLRLTKGVLPEVHTHPAAALEAALRVKQLAAEKEADSVYMVRVPPHESLAPLPSTLAVKPTSVAPLLDASKESLLRTMVPDMAARALSKYSELVDGLIREQATLLGDCSDAARLRLRELELPEVLDALSGGQLPASLLDECAQVCRHGSEHAVMQHLPRLADMSRACASALAAAAATLSAAEEECGGADALTAGVREKVKGYEASLAAAMRSDGVLSHRARAAEPQLATLDPGAAAAATPRLQPPPSPTPGDVAAAPALRATLTSLEANATERAGLEDLLKDLKAGDDILPRIMVSKEEGMDAVFSSELSKYDAPRAAVAANVATSQALLARLGGQHAVFAAAHDLPAFKQRMAAYVDDLREALRVWRELQGALSEGVSFYGQLRAAAAAVADEAAGVAGARRAAAEERQREAARREAAAQQSRADGERAAHLAASEREAAAAARAQAEAQHAQWMAAQAHAQAQQQMQMQQMQAASLAQATVQLQRAQVQQAHTASPPPSWPPAQQYGAAPPVWQPGPPAPQQGSYYVHQGQPLAQQQQPPPNTLYYPQQPQQHPPGVPQYGTPYPPSGAPPPPPGW